jgi:hypothetical protein
VTAYLFATNLCKKQDSSDTEYTSSEEMSIGSVNFDVENNQSMLLNPMLNVNEYTQKKQRVGDYNFPVFINAEINLKNDLIMDFISENEIENFKKFIKNNKTQKVEFSHIDYYTRIYTLFLSNYAELYLDYCKINKEISASFTAHSNFRKCHLSKERYNILKQKNTRLDKKWMDILKYRSSTDLHLNEYIRYFASFVGYERILGKKGPISSDDLSFNDRPLTPFEFINSWSVIETFIDIKDILIEGQNILLLDCELLDTKRGIVQSNTSDISLNTTDLKVDLINDLVKNVAVMCQRIRNIVSLNINNNDNTLASRVNNIGILCTKGDISNLTLPYSSLLLSSDEKKDIDTYFSFLNVQPPNNIKTIDGHYVAIPMEICLKTLCALCCYIKDGYCIVPIRMALTNVLIPLYFEEWSKYLTLVRDSSCIAMEEVYPLLGDIIDPYRTIFDNYKQKSDTNPLDTTIADEFEDNVIIDDVDSIMDMIQDKTTADIERKERYIAACDLISTVSIPLKCEINDLFKKIYMSIRVRGNTFSNNVSYRNDSRVFIEEEYNFNSIHKINSTDPEKSTTTRFYNKTVDVEDIFSSVLPEDIADLIPACFRVILFKLENERHIKHYDRIFLINQLKHLKLSDDDILEYISNICSGQSDASISKRLTNDVKATLKDYYLKSLSSEATDARGNTKPFAYYASSCKTIMERNYPMGNELRCPYNDKLSPNTLTKMLTWKPTILLNLLRSKANLKNNDRVNLKDETPFDLADIIESKIDSDDAVAFCNTVQQRKVSYKSRSVSREQTHIKTGMPMVIWKSSLDNLVQALSNVSL